jgi:hypothetical protein
MSATTRSTKSYGLLLTDVAVVSSFGLTRMEIPLVP